MYMILNCQRNLSEIPMAGAFNILSMADYFLYLSVGNCFVIFNLFD